jgi:hypothetical protein
MHCLRLDPNAGKGTASITLRSRGFLPDGVGSVVSPMASLRKSIAAVYWLAYAALHYSPYADTC